MKTVFFKTSEAVASHCGTMEADTISKNGRSSKSQMSRGNVKKFIATFFTACIILVGCDKDDGNIDRKNDGVAITEIKAKIENASEFSMVKKVKLMMKNFSTDKEDVIVEANFKDGGFTIKLPETLNAKYLATWSDIYLLLPEFTISDMNAKFGEGLSIQGFNTDDEMVADFFYVYLGEKNYTFASYYYSDRDVEISGKIETYNSNLTCLLNLKKGWNMVYQTESTESGKSNVIMSTNAVSNLKWYGSVHEQQGSAITEITAKVENASDFNGLTNVKLTVETPEKNEVIATTDFRNGGFTLNLPETVEVKYLISVEEVWGFVGEITVSNKNAKLCLVNIEGYNSQDEHIAVFYYVKEKGNTFSLVIYFYTDSDVNISGTGKYTEDKIEYIDVCSLFLKKGWNSVYVTSTVASSNKQVTTEYTSIPIEGLKWYGEFKN